MKKRYLFLILIVLSIASIFIGVSSISIKDIFELNIDKLEVIFISRLPRLIAIIVAGVGLSISGLIMQQISKNKFVSPTTAATVDFAKLGILFSMVVLTSATTMQKMITAFIFAVSCEPADAFGGPDRAHDSFSDVQTAINYALTSFFPTGGIRGGTKNMEKFSPRLLGNLNRVYS